MTGDSGSGWPAWTPEVAAAIGLLGWVPLAAVLIAGPGWPPHDVGATEFWIWVVLLYASQLLTGLAGAAAVVLGVLALYWRVGQRGLALIAIVLGALGLGFFGLTVGAPQLFFRD